MNKILLFIAVFVITKCNGQKSSLVTLKPENFNQIIGDGNTFVVFINNFENYKKFIEMLKEVTKVSAAANDEESRKLKFGIFDCKENSLMCTTLEISKNVEFKFYGKSNNWPAFTRFLTQVIGEVLQEDNLIDLLDKPGRLLVLFKVVSCPYCQDTLEEWHKVKKYFNSNERVKIFTIDCTRRRPICRKFGVRGYPKIKFIYNSENNHQTVFSYEGDRSYKDIRNFADEYIKATMK